MIFKSQFDDIDLRDQSIGERVFEGVSRAPDRIVLRAATGPSALTGGQLMSQVKRLAGGLQRDGFGKGRTVAIMAPNCPEFCVIFHAVCWAGGTVTTLNPSYTEHEIHHQLLDSGADLLVTTSQMAKQAQSAISGTSVQAIARIDDADGAEMTLADLMGESQPEQTPVDLDRHVAVLPYSSGTTGLPKGVMLSHRNLVCNIDQSLSVANIRPGDVSPVFLPFFHIYGMGVMMNAYLAAGGSLVTMERFDLELFLSLSQTYRARSLRIVPPVALMLAKHPMVDDFDLSSVETIVAAAAPLGGEVSEAIAKRLGCVCAQGFGMTELSPTSHGSPKDLARAGSCGLAVPNTLTRIVDPDTSADLGPDQEGEIWIKGPQVMIGYHNNPVATAATIVEDGWLRTGDLGCVDSDGYLFIRDRLKELIKYNGFQVAPAELEAVLVAHPDVQDAAVIGVPDDAAGEVPVAFIVLAPGAAQDSDALSAHVAHHLAPYKKIHRFEFVQSIPKSAAGKILRRVLRAQMIA